MFVWLFGCLFALLSDTAASTSLCSWTSSTAVARACRVLRVACCTSRRRVCACCLRRAPCSAVVGRMLRIMLRVGAFRLHAALARCTLPMLRVACCIHAVRWLHKCALSSGRFPSLKGAAIGDGCWGTSVGTACNVNIRHATEDMACNMAAYGPRHATYDSARTSSTRRSDPPAVQQLPARPLQWQGVRLDAAGALSHMCQCTVP